jgi:Uma2 family endonuclease
MSAQPQPRLTAEQYLDLDRAADYRSEYYDGRMYAMSGGSYPHGQLILNFGAELRSALKQTACSVTTSDIRLRVNPNGLYTYPDIMVVCGERMFAEGRRDTLLNPRVIVEVLSPSTEAHDRGLKFREYRTIPSLQEYALVSQSEVRVELFQRRSDDQWLLSDFAGLEASVEFQSLNCRIALSEIYDRVTLEPESLS